MSGEARLKRVAILGGSGFTGAELYRLLRKHPGFDVAFISSESNAGLPVDKYYAASVHKKKISSLKFSRASELEGHYDAVFSCLPTGELPKIIARVAEHADYVFNVSGDYRITDTELLQRHYPETLKHAFEGGWHYFVPEFSEIDRTKKVINLPGCMAVATLYTLYPLVAHGLIEDRVITDAKTGSSGGGKSTKEHHAERTNNFRAFKLHGHRHKPEIEQALSDQLGRTVSLQFSVFSLDLPRGIMATSYSLLKEGVTAVDVRKAFYSAYADKPFVHYIPSGNGAPMIKTVNGTNFAETGAYVEGRNCVSLAAIDNLLKGAAGQAVQAANLYFGFPEEEGLPQEGEGAWP
ncbi:N-acetyl-gamma-glutamyl-phosphate reductase [Paenibacillus sp. MMS18-CY102]|uniref:N-acetyl-gamma-glutamyl-phosphate reductase n=1 Tax=Paenibacillus sp. MMS18-CY102 TaxID=2682849 RepID=UPI001365B0A0|nr:N-acetyl-gamma-glutamyl-phosphate reductase [Paenibacillus sp. MMS18-CY102]MWC29620.1 N-acetyl-gamma-glutamyl-phosphate reductase [Paenibacillus sp. MMS18-CY102]